MKIEQDTINHSQLILLLIGWFLGIASTLIFEVGKKFIEKREIKKAIKTELDELRLRLAAINLELTFRIGDIDLNYAKWIKPYYKLLYEGDTYAYLRKVPKITNTITHLPDNEFQNCLIDSRNRRRSNDMLTTAVVQKIELAYLKSKYGNISFFKEKLLLQFAQLQKELIGINECIDDIRYYHNKSFENLSNENQVIIEQNINSNTFNLRNSTKYLINLIEEILYQLSRTHSTLAIA
jgi:hypothetical protein